MSSCSTVPVPASEPERDRSSLEDIVFSRVAGDNAHDFSFFAAEACVERLVHDTAGRNGLAFGATCFATPVGFIHAFIDRQRNASLIDCFQVLPAFRSRGIGRALLALLEAGLRASGCGALIVKFRKHETKQEDSLPIESVLRASGWPAPEAVRHIFRIYHTEEILDEPWMQYPLPPALSIMAWDSLTSDQENGLRTREPYRKTDAGYLSPFPEGEIDFVTSLWLRREDEIVGWMVNTKLSEDSILFKHWYVLPGFRNPRVALALLAESIRRFVSHGYRLAIYTAVMKRTRLLRLYKNLMSRHLDGITVEFQATKELEPGKILSDSGKR